MVFNNLLGGPAGKSVENQPIGHFQQLSQGTGPVNMGSRLA